MKTEEINAVQTVYSYQPNKEERTGQSERAGQAESRSREDAYEVEISEEAREQREYIEAEREKSRIEENQRGTYNASAKIGG